MGLMSTIFGDRGRKDALLRLLIKRRIAADPGAAAMGFRAEMVDALGRLDLLGTPEATIATIVESFATLIESGVTPSEAIGRIEWHRSPLGMLGEGRTNDLEVYVGLRVALEHGGTPGLTGAIVKQHVAAARQHYGIAIPEPYDHPSVKISRGPAAPPAELKRPHHVRCPNCWQANRANAAEGELVNLSCMFCRWKFAFVAGQGIR